MTSTTKIAASTTKMASTMPLRTLPLYVSDLAGVLGRHSFRTKEQSLAQLWQRLYPTEWKTACQEAGRCMADEATSIQEKQRRAEYYQRLVVASKALEADRASRQERIVPLPGARLATFVATTPLDELPVPEQAAQAVEAQVLTQVQMPVLTPIQQTLVQAQFTASGTAHEQQILDRAERKLGRAIVERNRTRFSWTHPTALFSIVGRIDGWDASTETIYEAKERQSRLFGHVPQYEWTTLQFYMLLTGAKQAILVESYRSRHKEHRVVYEPAVVTTMLRELEHDVCPRIVSKWSRADLFQATLRIPYASLLRSVLPRLADMPDLVVHLVDAYCAPLCNSPDP
jgi:hypothetical protein